MCRSFREFAWYHPNVRLYDKQLENWFFRGIIHLMPKGIPQCDKDFGPIICISNLYKLTTKCVTALMQLMAEERSLISDNHMGYVN